MEMAPTLLSSRDVDFINELSDDLLLKILDQLPAKSAVKSKAVCKRWFSLISHSCFVHRHVHNPDHRNTIDTSFSLILRHDPDSLNSKHSEFLQPSSIYHRQIIGDNHQLLRIIKFLPPNFSAVAYFNDLIVCRNRNFFPSVYYLCNPITRQQLMLPLPDPCFGEDNSHIVGLVCYPRCCDAQYRYKIVRVPKTKPHKFQKKFKVEIFCSESHEWSQSRVFSSRKLSFNGTSSCVTYNKILHWVDGYQRIVAYNPLKNKKRCRVINSPANFLGDVQTEVGMCGGSLKLCQVRNCKQYMIEASLIVWKLENYSEGLWQLEHQIKFKDMNSGNCLLAEQAKQETPAVNMAAFHAFDDDVVYLNFPDGLVCCNMRTRVLELVCKLENRPGKGTLPSANLFPLMQRSWPTPVPPLPANFLPY